MQVVLVSDGSVRRDLSLSGRLGIARSRYTSVGEA